jgi:hypothetical protein
MHEAHNYHLHAVTGRLLVDGNGGPLDCPVDMSKATDTEKLIFSYLSHAKRRDGRPSITLAAFEALTKRQGETPPEPMAGAVPVASSPREIPPAPAAATPPPLPPDPPDPPEVIALATLGRYPLLAIIKTENLIVPIGIGTTNIAIAREIAKMRKLHKVAVQ